MASTPSPASRRKAGNAAATLAAGTKVHLNLDTYENEEPAEPFNFVLGGRAITAKDPGDIDWRLLADIDDPDAFADTVLEEDDAVFFKDYTPFPARKLNALSTAYREHYGLGNPGN